MAVREAFARWARPLLAEQGRVERVGYFGSLARGDWGVGSDLDVIIRVDAADWPFFERPSQFDTSALPVPVDLVVYTEEEWDRLVEERRGPARGPIVWYRDMVQGTPEDRSSGRSD